MSTQYPTPQQQYRPADKPAGIATASVVLGAVGFVVGICSVIGLILGLVARGKAQRGEISPARVKTGIVVSSISLGLGVLVFIALVAGGANSDTTTTAPAATASSTITELATPTQTPSSAPAETPAAAPEPAAAAASTTTEAPAPAPSTSAPPAAPGIGQAVIAKDVAYTVTAFECGISQVGSSSFGRTAQGEFCEAVIDIKNQGTRPTMFNSSEARAYIGDIRYDADGQASIYAEDGNAFLTDINPGNSVTAKVYFDVPSGSRPDRIEIGAGLFSKGATISVA